MNPSISIARYAPPRWVGLAFWILTARSLPAADTPSAVSAFRQHNAFEFLVERAVDPCVYARPLTEVEKTLVKREAEGDSIGSAFTLDGKTFFTAAHVISGALEREIPKWFVKDAAGRKYAIRSITALDFDRDYAVFQIDGAVAGVLPVKADAPAIDKEVFAVGNALGEGVVARGGQLTSLTPDEDGGDWKWIRFSAPASPGNSGGALVNGAGRPVGLVVRRSSQENLNVALPLSEVTYLSNRIPWKSIHSIEFPYTAFEFRTNREWPLSLPLTPADFANRWYSNGLVAAREAWADLTRDKAAELYPRALGSEAAREFSYSPRLPILIHCLTNGWVDAGDFRIGTVSTNERGEIAEVAVPRRIFAGRRVYGLDFVIRITESDQTKGGLPGERYAMALAKALDLKRTLRAGKDGIPVSSLGTPTSTGRVVDSLGRAWDTARWDIPWLDGGIGARFLPVPDGAIVLCRMGDRDASWDTYDLDLDFVSSHIRIFHQSPLEKWAMASNNLPRAFPGISVDGKTLEVADFKLDLSAAGFGGATLGIFEGSSSSGGTEKLLPKWVLLTNAAGQVLSLNRFIDPRESQSTRLSNERNRQHQGLPPYDGKVFTTQAGRQALASVVEIMAEGEGARAWVLTVEGPTAVSDETLREYMDKAQAALTWKVKKLDGLELEVTRAAEALESGNLQVLDKIASRPDYGKFLALLLPRLPTRSVKEALLVDAIRWGRSVVPGLRALGELAETNGDLATAAACRRALGGAAPVAVTNIPSGKNLNPVAILAKGLPFSVSAGDGGNGAMNVGAGLEWNGTHAWGFTGGKPSTFDGDLLLSEPIFGGRRAWASRRTGMTQFQCRVPANCTLLVRLCFAEPLSVHPESLAYEPVSRIFKVAANGKDWGEFKPVESDGYLYPVVREQKVLIGPDGLLSLVFTPTTGEAAVNLIDLRVVERKP